MEITRQDAVRVLEALGYNDASEWSKSKMQTRLEKLHELVADDQSIGDEELDALLDELIGCGSEGESIVLLNSKTGPKSNGAASSGGGAAVAVAPQKTRSERTKAAKQPSKPQAAKAAPAKSAKPATAPSASSGAKKQVVKKEYARVRPAEGRPYFAGAALKEFGLNEGITDEIIDRVEELMGEGKNRKESEAWLKNAWHILRGYTSTKRKSE